MANKTVIYRANGMRRTLDSTVADELIRRKIARDLTAEDEHKPRTRRRYRRRDMQAED